VLQGDPRLLPRHPQALDAEKREQEGALHVQVRHLEVPEVQQKQWQEGQEGGQAADAAAGAETAAVAEQAGEEADAQAEPLLQQTEQVGILTLRMTGVWCQHWGTHFPDSAVQS
jgi:hypothetical protein